MFNWFDGGGRGTLVAAQPAAKRTRQAAQPTAVAMQREEQAEYPVALAVHRQEGQAEPKT